MAASTTAGSSSGLTLSGPPPSGSTSTEQAPGISVTEVTSTNTTASEDNKELTPIEINILKGIAPVRDGVILHQLRDKIEVFQQSMRDELRRMAKQIGDENFLARRIYNADAHDYNVIICQQMGRDATFRRFKDLQTGEDIKECPSNVDRLKGLSAEELGKLLVKLDKATDVKAAEDRRQVVGKQLGVDVLEIFYMKKK
ncbi:hypothetical protein MMC10_010552 [Thelotrema lepadinum]|nr:hypothetical protein [Thelotrema lepadinum]